MFGQELKYTILGIGYGSIKKKIYLYFITLIKNFFETYSPDLVKTITVDRLAFVWSGKNKNGDWMALSGLGKSSIPTE